MGTEPVFHTIDVGKGSFSFNRRIERQKILTYTPNLCLRPSDKHLLVDPHERARVVGFAFILDAVEAVSPLAVVPLVVVVVLHLPHRFEHPRLCELRQKHMELKQTHRL